MEFPKKVTIEVIDHSSQVYETVGDWRFVDGELKIFISEMGDWRYNMLVAFHELAEVLMCYDDGVEQKDVDAFDVEYEKNRKEGDDSEPGDSPLAPYCRQHSMATALERALSVHLGVNWKEYDKAVTSL